jgi:hypothetical protein
VLRGNQALGLVAEAARPARVALDALGIGPGIGTVDGDRARGDAFDEKPLARVGELQSVRGALRAEVGGEVFRCEQAGDDARARTGDDAGLNEAARQL